MKIIAKLRDEPGLDYPENLDLTDRDLKQKFIAELCWQIRSKLQLKDEDEIDIIFESEDN